jgi:outer membrane receptor protein involved in Fe transport
VYDQYSRGGKLTPINFFVGAVDYSTKLGKKISMETGLKGTLSTFTNDISFERLIQNSWVKDQGLSAEYKLDEKYSAAYASFNISVNKKTDAKMGLRYEYTSSNLGTKDKKNIVDRQYGNLFPSFFISHKLNENNSINLSYSRRITRPTFNDLAPFTYFANPTTLLTGNPALQPAIANTIKTDYTYKQYYFSLSYSKEDRAITGFQPETDSVAGKIILAPQNLVNRKTLSLIISFPINITQWWTMQYNITGLWQQINAVYKGKELQLQQPNLNINGSQTFRLPKDFSIEVSGFYQSKVLNGISLTKGFGSLDAGIRKKLGAKNGSLVFNASNILNTLWFKENTNLPEQNLVSGIDLTYSLRMFKLTYTRSFGKEKLKQKRERLTGAEDEKSRVN